MSREHHDAGMGNERRTIDSEKVGRLRWQCDGNAGERKTNNEQAAGESEEERDSVPPDRYWWCR